jgi:hypothetical protein
MCKPLVRVDYGSGWQLVDFPNVLWEKVKQELYDKRFEADGSLNPQTVATAALLAEAPEYFPGVRRCEVIDPEEYDNGETVPIMPARCYKE